MNIEKLELTHFGKFHLRTINFTPGLNVVYGKNEAGKSTIHAFVRSMLFGMNESPEGKEIYEKYIPWQTPEEYGGKLWINKNGHTYRLERCFLKDKAFMRLYDETEDTELENPKESWKELLEGLNENNYLNTICIEQLKSATGPLLADELESMVINTSQSKNVRINVEEAKRLLQEKRDAVKERIVDDVDTEFNTNEKQLEASKGRMNKLQKLKYVKETQFDELDKKVSQEKVQADEDMLDYERERDELRRRYESAQSAYDNAPEADESDLNYRSWTWLPFLIMAALFTAGAAYMYLTQGLESPTILYVVTGFCCAAFLCFIGVVVALVLGIKKEKRLQANYEMAQELRSNLKSCLNSFEECKKRVPAGLEERCQPLIEKQEKTGRELEYLKHQLKEESKVYYSLTDKNRKLEKAVSENRKNYEEIEAINTALKTIYRVSSRIHDTFGNLLNTEASRLLSQVTDGKYEKIVISNEMKVLIYTEDREVELESVSRGTIEQIYLCIRVAAAELLWKKEAMPFLFDDVFAYYDDDRLEAAMKMLKNCGHQTIIFSCHQREDRLL